MGTPGFAQEAEAVGYSASAGWWDRFRNAGISATDEADVRLSKSLLVWATGMVSLSSVLWLLMYNATNIKLSATGPFIFQLILTANFLWYTRTGNFKVFRDLQLALFLFAPFAVQWSMGNSITASGVVLWGLLAPVGAILCIGARESIPWFIVWVALVALSGGADVYLAVDSSWRAEINVPLQVSLIFLAINFISVSTVLYLLLRYAAKEKQRNYIWFLEAHKALQLEQNKSEGLLLNILPAHVAERLKDGQQNIADRYADVTVLFADVVGFSSRARGMGPQELFTMLNRLFSIMDDFSEYYELEKIKTIGDAYMVAGGLPDTHEDYTAAVLSFAVEINRRIQNEAELQGISIHVGIATGPVVAGVIGKRKFIYDMWGDTVNLASRLCSNSDSGRILVDETTYHRLRGRFQFDDGHSVNLKGERTIMGYSARY